MSDAIAIGLTVNGQQIQATVPARRLLVHLLRDQLGLTGTHVGCDTSQCGACTVSIDGDAVKSCTVLAVQASGSVIKTIEGLAPNGQLDAVQQAFKDCHALQCGFCTPGMVIAAHHLLSHNAMPNEAEIREGLHGNLCRCTGYHNIVLAVQRAAMRLSETAAHMHASPRAAA